MQVKNIPLLFCSSSAKKRPHDKDASEPKKKKKATGEFQKGSYKGSGGAYSYDGTVLDADDDVRARDGYDDVPVPKRDAKTGVLVFDGAPEFRPNMTPKEVLQAGSFGGTYFRPIKSSVTGLKYNKMWLELPQNWLEGMDVKKTVASSIYDEGVNTYKVRASR